MKNQEESNGVDTGLINSFIKRSEEEDIKEHLYGYMKKFFPNAKLNISHKVKL